MNRFAAMQDWPLLMFRAATPTVAAISTSPDGMTINGSLPPNSITAFLIEAPAASPTLAPALSLPVNVTAATRSSVTICLTILDEINRVWNTPGGKPASKKIFSMFRAERGTFEACFRSATLPAIKRGCGEPKHLPERKIPRHDREHGSDWQKADIAFNGFSLNRFVGKKSCCIFSIVAATGGAFFYFGDCCFQCLAHLNCDGARPIAFSLLENVGGTKQHLGSLFETGLSVPFECFNGQP